MRPQGSQRVHSGLHLNTRGEMWVVCLKLRRKNGTMKWSW